jgi:glycosyltransferase involved in cell wall biosynthesis
VNRTPSASIVIPTRARPGYLDVTLESVIHQATRCGAEVLVVSDGIDDATAAVVEGQGATLIRLRGPAGANAARNAGFEAAASDLIVFIDDDVRAPQGWLDAFLAGAQAAPDREVFGGPISAEFEGGGPRLCGRESPPITTLDGGPADCDIPLVWSANMAIRRSALERIGPFDAAIRGRGEEEDWERRYAAHGGRIRYLAGAGLQHRRTRDDSTVWALARAEYRLGRSARRNDVRKRAAPAIRTELRVLAGCLWHTARRLCANGIVMAAHSVGRLTESAAERCT